MIGFLVLIGLLDGLQSADSRVATVAWRLQTANAPICTNPVPNAGLVLQSLDQFTEATRGEAVATFGLRDAPQASVVVEGGAAWRAGLRSGDEILAIDDVATPQSRGGRPSYEVTAQTEAALAEALGHPPVRLKLRTRQIAVTGDAACDSRVQLVPENAFDASADGKYVQITGPMYAFAERDDDLKT